MPDVDQKLIDNFSFLISTVVPKLLKNFFTLAFGGQIGIGPFLREIGGNGMALTISTFLFLIIFFSCAKVIVEIKLTTVCFDRNFKSLIIFSPTVGVTDKKTQSDLSTISWFVLDIIIFLNFFFKLKAIFLFLGEIIICLQLILKLQIPIITEEAIFPVPIKPNLINL